MLFFSPAPEVKYNHSKEQDTSASIQTTAAPTPIDESQPVTSIQIRLADGTRYVMAILKLSFRLGRYCVESAMGLF